MPNGLQFLRLAWPAYKKHFWQFIALGLINSLIAIAIGVVAAIFGTVSPVFVLLFAILAVLLFLGLFFVSFQALAMAAVDNTDAGMMTIYKKGWQVMLAATAVLVLTTLLKVLGTVAFIVPGLILSIWYAFVFIEVIKLNGDAISAIKRSTQMAKKAPWQVSQVIFSISVLIAVLSFIPIGNILNTFVLYPLYLIVLYLVYKKLAQLKKPLPATKTAVIATVMYIVILFALVVFDIYQSTYWQLPPLAQGHQQKIPGSLDIQERFKNLFNKSIQSIQEN